MNGWRPCRPRQLSLPFGTGEQRSKIALVFGLDTGRWTGLAVALLCAATDKERSRSIHPQYDKCCGTSLPLAHENIRSGLQTLAPVTNVTFGVLFATLLNAVVDSRPTILVHFCYWANQRHS